MYSMLPAVVSALFLGYGMYVIAVKGFNRVSTSFFALCITTFFWQGTWAVLFQVNDPTLATVLVRLGYLLIIFLPTSLYLFLVEISGRKDEHRWVWLSYGLAGVLAVLNVGTDLFVEGHYRYFFGYYPQAGAFHPLHVLQTVVVVNRGLYITWRQQRTAPHDQQIRLRICIASLLIYFFAAVDYLCNYGIEFYPPGVVFIAISLGLIMVAVTRYNLMSPVAVAATVAHEMRTPLAIIRMQADALSRLLPEIHQGYQLAVAHGLIEPRARPTNTQRLVDMSRGITRQIDRSNVVIDMMLASSRMEQIDTSEFCVSPMKACVDEAVETYPFIGGERDWITVAVAEDFEFHGSRPLMVYVLFNLLKNSLFAIKAAGRGGITISLSATPRGGQLVFTDTGCGIPRDTLPRIFETFFTTKKSAGAGIGLAFCRRVLDSFGAQIQCESVEGEFTTFVMVFPHPSALSGTQNVPLARAA